MANKKNVKSYNNDMNIKEGLILVGVLAIVVLVIYALTVGAQKLGWFNEGYVKPEISTAVISYENSLAGTIFNKSDNEYYVMIADFSGNNNIYLSSSGSLYKQKEGHLPIYAVDLSSFLNQSIIGDTSNPSAQRVTDLSVNGPTLIHVKDGRNFHYYEGTENIKNALGV